MAAFYLSDHQGKGHAYAQALVDAGWDRADNPASPNLTVGFYDHDVGEGGNTFRRGMDYFYGRGIPIMLYPHAARPMVQWDGMYKIWPHTRLKIIIAEGHRRVMEAFGYPIRTAICGWSMCEIIPWQPVEVKDRINVLFGPMHPNHNGWMHPVDRAANAIVFQTLLNTPGINLKVRHIKSVALNGLWGAEGVKYVLANPNGSTNEIDQADLVIGHQTFAYLAAARGKPLIMFGDDMYSHSGNDWSNFRWVKNYPAYRDIMRYPVEFEGARSPLGLRDMMEKAMSYDLGKDWRAQFIGEQFNPGQFVKTVEENL